MLCLGTMHLAPAHKPGWAHKLSNPAWIAPARLETLVRRVNEKNDDPSRRKFAHLSWGNKLIPCTDVSEALEAVLDTI